MVRHQAKRQKSREDHRPGGPASGDHHRGDVTERPDADDPTKPASKRQSEAGANVPSHRRTDEARPTGQPTSDRHAAETAHFWEDEDPDQGKAS